MRQKYFAWHDETIVNQVAALKSMVDAFSEYARSKPDMATSEIDLNQLVREVLGLYEAGARAIAIDTVLAPGLPKVVGSPTQLRQVLHNLLRNGLDAMLGAGITATVYASYRIARSAHGKAGWRSLVPQLLLIAVLVAVNFYLFAQPMAHRA